ncbi:MAG: hypothetical protein MSC31_16310 [Solirubrobacteraceae bacterium MAG38_C4-C5]|nr:hypothetical protein [Candidatus Siliceabacter maunaloa]
MQRREGAKREAWLNAFEAAAETPLRIADYDLTPSTLAALLVHGTDDGRIEIHLET